MFTEEHARYEAKLELDMGEELLWCGKPNARLQMERSMPSVIAGAVIAAGSVWFTLNEASLGWLWIAGMPVILIGLTMMFSPYLLFLRARMTIFAVTNHRVMVIHDGAKRTVKSYLVRNLECLRCEVRPDGSGNVKFAVKAHNDDGTAVKATNVEFANIMDVASLEMVVQQTFAEELAAAVAPHHT